MDHLAVVVVYFVAATFVASGVSKIVAGSQATLSVVRGYRLLPRPLAAVVARVLPWSEIAIGALVLVGPSSVPPRLLATIALTGFGAAIAVNLARGNRQIDCGCFGRSEREQLSWSMVASNVALAASLWLFGAQAHPASLSSVHTVAETFLAAFAVGVAWILRFSIALVRRSRAETAEVMLST